MTVREALAQLLLVYSQQHTGAWSASDIMLVQECKAALERSDAMDRQELSEAQQAFEREEREASREGRERHPEENWKGGPGNSRR